MQRRRARLRFWRLLQHLSVVSQEMNSQVCCVSTIFYPRETNSTGSVVFVEVPFFFVFQLEAEVLPHVGFKLRWCYQVISHFDVNKQLPLAQKCMHHTAEWLFGAIYRTGGKETLLYSQRVLTPINHYFNKVSIFGVEQIDILSASKVSRYIAISIFLPTPTRQCC